MTNTPSRRFILKSLLGLAGIVALTLAPDAVAQERAKIRLVLPTPATTYQLPYLIPKDSGWYAQRGLDVEEVFVNGDSTALRTVLSGSADLTIVGPPTVFQAHIEGAKVKYIGSFQPQVDYHIIAAKSVSELAQLADKTFASAGPSDLTTEIPRLVMRKHGVATENVKFLQVGGHAARLQALEAGRVQGALVNTLTSLIGQRNGNANVITRVAKDFPKLGYVMLVAKSSDLDEPAKRAAYETFMKGIIYGSRFILDEPDRAAELLVKRVPDLPIDLVKPVLRELNSINAWGANGGLDREMVSFTSNASVEWKMIRRAVTPDEIIDERVVKAALAEMGTR